MSRQSTRSDKERGAADVASPLQTIKGGATITVAPPFVLPFGSGVSRPDHARSKRSAFITLVQAATKSFTNFSLLSSWA
jgi:hypothetical protein